MSDNDKFEAAKFKPGQSGNPAGKAKGTVSGRLKALSSVKVASWMRQSAPCARLTEFAQGRVSRQ